MTLIPQEYGCEISTAAYIWYQRHTLFWFLIVFSLAPYLSSTPRLPHHIYGREHYRRMLRFASLADFLKVLLITTWSPSSSLWEEIRIIIPLRWSWRKTCESPFTAIRIRSEWEQALTVFHKMICH